MKCKGIFFVSCALDKRVTRILRVLLHFTITARQILLLLDRTRVVVFNFQPFQHTHTELIIVKQQILKNTRLLGPFVLHSRPYYFLNTSIINTLKGKNTTKRVPEDN